MVAAPCVGPGPCYRPGVPVPSIPTSASVLSARARALRPSATLAVSARMREILREVVVRGNDRVSDVAIRHLANVPRGAFLPTVDLDGVAEGVLRHPWIASARVRRVLPDRLVIEVEERRTALLLALDGLYRVAPDGTVFARARPPGLDAPVLTGLGVEPLRSHPDLGRRVLGLSLALLREVDDAEGLARDDLSEIHFDPLSGFELILRSGARLLLGWRPPGEALADLARLRVSLDGPVSVDLAGRRVALVRTPPSASPAHRPKEQP